MARTSTRIRVQERVVTMGGGTGSFTMLSELKKVASRLWAIVTMMDSGGSSRRLIDEFGRPLPLGDLRQALVALSRSSRLWSDVFNYRFPEADGSSDGQQSLSGHSLGNLILHSLQDINHGDLIEAIEDAEEILNTAGHVLPVTLEQATLVAELQDGTVIHGEDAIDQPIGRPVLPIKKVFLEPDARATVRARKALERADTVLIGPGDLYTSIIPCLLVDGIADALHSCEGELIYICNVMTKHGETDDFKASDFVRELHRYLGRRVDTVVVSTSTYPKSLLDTYQRHGARPVEADLEELRGLVPRVLAGPYSTTERLIRHDAERVLLAIWPELFD
jgi:uncharacterized cofD-like protein